MQKKTAKQKAYDDIIATNRKASHDYTIEKIYEAGLVLEGWEVKSMRAGKAQITDSYAIIKNNAIWWLGGVVNPMISTSTHKIINPNRTRKLLMHQKEIRTLIGALERKGYTLIPLKLYWKNNKIKIELGLAQGKKSYDKRASLKEREWQRLKEKLFKKRP